MVAGCESEGRAVPPIPADARAVLWAVQGSDGTWQVQAFDVGAGQSWQFSRRLEPGTEIVALSYRASLFNLDVNEGEVRPVVSGARRPLPTPDEIFSAQADAEDLTWSLETELPVGLDSFRIAALDPITCVDAGGCVNDATTEPRCARPCVVTAPEPANVPAPPTFAPCPAGWSEGPLPNDDEVVVCVGSAPDATPCSGGTFQGAAAASCERVGRACQGRFPPPPAEGTAVVYVDLTAPPGGDGSEAAPWTSISAALVDATEPTTLLVASGRYEETPALPDGITIQGACAGEVTVGNGEAWPAAADAHFRLRDVTLVGSMAIDSGGARLESVVLLGAESATEPALSVAGSAMVHLTNARVTAAGVAVHVGGDGQLDAETVELSGTVGLRLSGGAAATVRQARIHDSQDGVTIRDAAALSGTAMIVEDTTTGLTINGPDARATVDHLLLRRVFGPSPIRNLQGTSELRFVHVYDASEYGALVLTGEVRVIDGVFRDLEPNDRRTHGWGVRVDGGRFSGTRIRIARVFQEGIQVEGRTALGRLEDAIIEDVRLAPTGNDRPGGAIAMDGGSLEFERVVIRRVVRVGLAADASVISPLIAARDLVIEDVFRRSDDSRGQGIVIDDGTQLAVTRGRIQRTHGFGIEIKDGNTAGVLSDLVIADTGTTACFASECVLGNGVGLAVSATARLDLRRFQILRSAETGLRLDATLGVAVSDGELEGNGVGLWVSDPSLSIFQLVERVRFEANETNIRLP